ncbi:energy-coupling factor ABC transporter substrate-binding protein [Azonexus fungiphilus]|uniref:energy-coupling factor ABC transporter substrate-binding protein n=1 Tax=Azonexus fungiphilus TaxID=146940 RepID=UPI00156AF2A4|nr:energy-coupling factor ABC transporter substrate-binding protein [Azonexus fungiphilus]NHC08527.1 energy-coupling factor ABC transporter substrate-binding protein [Azonexus fungiphilus]
MKRQNGFLLGLIVLLIVLPLWLVPAPVAGPDGEVPEAFAGADGKAEALILEIAPDYQPWFEPFFEPPGGEFESLLFALQAALGAGFIGFWLGGAMMRERLKKQSDPTRAD